MLTAVLLCWITSSVTPSLLSSVTPIHSFAYCSFITVPSLTPSSQPHPPPHAFSHNPFAHFNLHSIPILLVLLSHSCFPGIGKNDSHYSKQCQLHELVRFRSQHAASCTGGSSLPLHNITDTCRR